jgi:putative transposase
MVISIQGRRMYLWRAVESEGEFLNVLVRRRRDNDAALRLALKLFKKSLAPSVLVTDKLPAY